jgi:hypothetical protein
VAFAINEFGDRRGALSASLPWASLSALGVVFGNIGTSPLYTLKSVLAVTGEAPPASATLGSFSLIVWTLIVVITIKYVAITMRVDNDVEGGIPHGAARSEARFEAEISDPAEDLEPSWARFTRFKNLHSS